MRHVSFLLVALLLAGCSASSTVLDVAWNDEIVAALNRDAGRIDTVVTVSGGVFRDPGRVDATPEGLRMRADTPIDPVTVPSEAIGRIIVTKRDHGSGFAGGFLGGAAFGAILGFAAGDDCSTSHSFVRFDRKSTSLAMGLAGGLLGGIIGAAVGARRTTIYRFDNGAAVRAGPGGVSYRMPIGR